MSCQFQKTKLQISIPSECFSLKAKTHDNLDTKKTPKETSVDYDLLVQHAKCQVSID
jgi:hypothetical protein